MKNLVAYEKERIFSYSSRIALNSAETVAFHKISGPGNIGEIMVFDAKTWSETWYCIIERY